MHHGLIEELVSNLEAEINNGGFDQYFFNSTGDRTAETIRALELIGAKKQHLSSRMLLPNSQMDSHHLIAMSARNNWKLYRLNPMHLKNRTAHSLLTQKI
jgi:hypothetical protein